MKITESRIRRIIREELLREFSRPPTPAEIRAAAAAVQAFNAATVAKNVTPVGIGITIAAAIGVAGAYAYLDSIDSDPNIDASREKSEIEDMALSIRTGAVDQYGYRKDSGIPAPPGVARLPPNMGRPVRGPDWHTWTKGYTAGINGERYSPEGEPRVYADGYTDGLAMKTRESTVADFQDAISDINPGELVSYDSEESSAYRGQSSLRTLEDTEEDGDIYVKIEKRTQRGPSARITVYKKSGDTGPTRPDQELATILIGPVRPIRKNRSGPCLGSWLVKWSKALPGWGPLVYDVAIEVASILAEGLTADSSAVSPSAKNVWDIYLKNRSLATSGTPLEIVDLDDAYAKFITPSSTSDDCERVPVRTHYPSYVGVANSYWDNSTPFDENLPDENMINDFGDPPEGTQSPRKFTKDFEEFYRDTGITKMFSVSGHPTIDRLKASGNLEITHPELMDLI